MFEYFRGTCQRWGFGKAIYLKTMTTLERYAGIHLFVIHSRRLDEDPPVDALPPGDKVCVFEPNDLSRFTQNPQLGLSEEFLRGAQDRGDVCVGYLEGGDLVSYGWLGRSDTPMESGLHIRVGQRYIYGYKTHTLPFHRGRRLLGAVLHECDRWLTANGYRYNIGYIRTHNFASITADRRAGNRVVGYGGYFSGFGKTRSFRSPGARRAGFQFVTTP